MIGRHVFASNGSSFDLAWTTVGWTEELAGERAGRLEEGVPWASDLIGAHNPPLLIGAVDRVLEADNLARLPRAFLPQDGRLGYSVWGAVEGVKDRVVTQTLLLDQQAFRGLAGFPAALVGKPLAGGDGGAGHGWLKGLTLSLLEQAGPLAPLELTFTEQEVRRFEGGRRASLAMLADVLIQELGEISAVDWIVAAYKSLYVARNGGAGVVVVADPGGRSGPTATSIALLRFVWLGLPLRDRETVFYTTSWLSGRRASPLLSPVPLRDASGHLSANDVAVVAVGALLETTAEDRFRAWAQRILAGGVPAGRLMSRADTRGWSLFEDRHLGELMGVYGGDASQDLSSYLFNDSLPKSTSLRRVRGLFLSRNRSDARSVLAQASDIPELDKPSYWYGVTRGLMEWDWTDDWAEVAVEAGLGLRGDSLDLGLVVSGLRRMVARGKGVGALKGALRRMEAHGASDGAREMVRLGLGLLATSGYGSQAPEFLGDFSVDRLMDSGVIKDLSTTLRGLAPTDPRGPWVQFLMGVWRRVPVDPSMALIEGLLELAWTESKVLGEPVLVQIRAEIRPGATNQARAAASQRVMPLGDLVGRLVESNPPLGLYLTLRDLQEVDTRRPAGSGGIIPVSRRKGTS